MNALNDIARRWWGEIPVYLFGLVCSLVCLFIWSTYGVDYDIDQSLFSFTLFYTCGIIYFFVDICWRLFRDRPARPLSWARQRYFSKNSLLLLIASLPAIALCATMIPLFSSMKSMIPMFTDYSWDPTFIAWDRAIFFGTDPWRVLQPILGYPAITAAMAFAYHVWVVFLYPGVIVMALLPSISNDLRRRFFLSYALAWSVVGGFLATCLASVGPAFAEPLLGIDTFTDQMDYLRAANEQIRVMTIGVQDMLIERFHDKERSIGSGITAMPSMHVAVSVLYWLAAREISPKAGRFFFWFMVLIWLGSVHLAYHYALDGLVSLVAIYGIWRTVPIVFRAWDRIPAPWRQPALRTNTVPAE